MIRIGRLAAGTVLAAVLGSGLAVAVPASPAAAAACPAPDSGVTVVVDFASLGGGVVVRCASGDPADGLAALQGAGFEYDFVPRQPGLVCRIAGRPDPCNGAPTTAYWSYWYADRGGSWTYSSRGAGSRDPAPGTVEGWAFGAGSQPGQPPPAPPPPEPPPDDPRPTDDGGADPPAAGGAPPPPDRPGDVEDPPPAAAEPDPGEPATGAPSSPADRPSLPGTEAGPVGPGGTSASTAPPAEPAASTATRTGGLAGVLVTAVVVAALAGAGFWTARRRSRVRPTPDPAGSDPAG